MLQRKTVIYAAIYSLILPIANSFESTVLVVLSALISFPFALGAYAGSEIFRTQFSFSYAPQIGAALAIFIQVILVLYLLKLLSNMMKHLTRKSTRTKNSWR